MKAAVSSTSGEAADGLRLLGFGDLRAVVEDLLRQGSAPAGGPIRVRWVGDAKPGSPRRATTLCEEPEPPHERLAGEDAVAACARRMAEMTSAVRRLRAVLDPAYVSTHLAAAARRVQAEQPPTPGLLLCDLEGYYCDDRYVGRAVGTEYVDSAAIVNAGWP